MDEDEIYSEYDETVEDDLIENAEPEDEEETEEETEREVSDVEDLEDMQLEQIKQESATHKAKATFAASTHVVAHVDDPYPSIQLPEPKIKIDYSSLSPAVREEIRKLASYKQYIITHLKGKSIYVPVNVRYVINSIIQGQGNEKRIADRDYIARQVDEFCERRLPEIFGRNLPYVNKAIINDALLGFKIVIRTEMASKRLVNKVTEASLSKIFDMIYKFSIKALASPGEMIGVTSGSSLGQPTTQLTLNTFHMSGVSEKSNINTGIERLKQILSVTKTENCKDSVYLTIRLLPEDAISLDRVKDILVHLDTNYFVDFINKIEIVQDPNKEIDAEMFAMHMKYNKMPSELSNLSLRIELNEAKMYLKRLPITDIQIILQTKFPQLYIVHDGKSVMRVFILRSIIGFNTDELLTFKDLIHTFELLTLTGIPGIKGFEWAKTVVPYRDEQGNQKSREEYVIYTSGTNFKEILRSNRIDKYRTVSNDVLEVYQRLGIEAARTVIANNIMTIFKTGGISISPAHINLLVNTMTYMGEPTPVSRAGLEKSKVSVLHQSTFEQPDKVYSHAAAYAEKDDMQGTSANIIFCQGMKGGTTGFKVYRLPNK